MICSFTHPGDPGVLTYTDTPLPDIHRATEMRVRLKAAGVNPIDTKLRQRGSFPLAQAADAHQWIENGEGIGKAVLTM